MKLKERGRERGSDRHIDRKGETGDFCFLSTKQSYADSEV